MVAAMLIWPEMITATASIEEWGSDMHQKVTTARSMLIQTYWLRKRRTGRRRRCRLRRRQWRQTETTVLTKPVAAPQQVKTPCPHACDIVWSHTSSCLGEMYIWLLSLQEHVLSKQRHRPPTDEFNCETMVTNNVTPIESFIEQRNPSCLMGQPDKRTGRTFENLGLF